MTHQGSEPAHYGKSRPVVPSRRVGALRRANSISCNQIVGANHQCHRHVKPDCPCSLEVDDQLEFRRLLYRKTGGTSEAKNFVDVDGGTAIKVGVVRPIRDQPSGIDVLLRDIDCVRIAPTAAAFPTPRG